MRRREGIAAGPPAPPPDMLWTHATDRYTWLSHGDALDAPHSRGGVWTLLARASINYPTRPAIATASESLSYRDYWDRVMTLADQLGNCGIRQLDVVLITGADGEAVATLAYALSILEATWVVAPRATAFQAGQIERTVTPSVILVPVEPTEPQACRIFTYTFIATRVSWDAPGRGLEAMFVTSGSSGRPQAVCLSSESICFAVASIQQVIGLGTTDVIAVSSPSSFDYGLYQYFLGAWTGALVSATPASPNVGAWWAQLRETQPTVLPLVPSMVPILRALAARENVIWPWIRKVTSTGSHLPQASRDWLHSFAPQAMLFSMYGLTECKRVSIMRPDEAGARPDSVGRAIPGTMATIVRADGSEAEPGEDGEIAVVGPHVAIGYHNAGDDTATRFGLRGGQWVLMTGDWGWIDSEGYIYVTGRRDSVFKYRGLRMSAAEVEEAMLRVPGVVDAVCIPPDDGGNLIAAYVGDVSEDLVRTSLVEWLGPERVPTGLVSTAAIPVTENGKPDTRALVARLGGQTNGTRLPERV